MKWSWSWDPINFSRFGPKPTTVGRKNHCSPRIPHRRRQLYGRNLSPWVPGPKDKWTQAQKAQYNEFVEIGLENWVLMNQITSKVDSDDKKMKTDWFILNKNRHRHSPRRSVLIYFSQVWLQVQFLITTVVFFLISPPSLSTFLLFFTTSPFSSLPSTWTLECLCWSLSHQHPPEVFGGSCKAEKHYLDISSSLMRPKN